MQEEKGEGRTGKRERDGRDGRITVGLAWSSREGDEMLTEGGVQGILLPHER